MELKISMESSGWLVAIAFLPGAHVALAEDLVFTATVNVSADSLSTTLPAIFSWWSR